MNKKVLKSILSLMIFVQMGLLVFVGSAKAGTMWDSISGDLKKVGGQAFYNDPTAEPAQKDIPTLVGKIIQIILTFLGVIFLVLILYSGYQWMMAGGNADAITEAKDRIVNATIGLAVVLAAYTLTYFVLSKVIDVTTK